MVFKTLSHVDRTIFSANWVKTDLKFLPFYNENVVSQ